MGDLAGKKVFITGAEQGIGRATAERLIKAGCDIYFHYHSDESGPKALVALAHSLGQKGRLRLRRSHRYRRNAALRLGRRRVSRRHRHSGQ